jgi:hypothetical protein
MRAVTMLTVVALGGCDARWRKHPVPEPAPATWGGLQPGPYAAGFRRDTVHGASVPLELFVWYPADPRSHGASLTLGDYLAAAFPMESTTPTLEGILAARIGPADTVASPDVLARILRARTFARRGATPVKQAFPLLLWSARHETVAAQSILSEYLASHGFVVAAAERVGGRLPAPFEVTDTSERLRVLEAQLVDLDSALACVLRRPNVNTEYAVVLAWSYGGESAAMLQQRHSEIDAVIGLSANILGGWVYQAKAALPQSGRTARPVAYVLLMETDSAAAPADSLAQSGDTTVVRFPGLRHGNFNVIEGLLPGLYPGIRSVQPWSRGGRVARDGYRAIAEAALRYARRIVGSADH